MAVGLKRKPEETEKGGFRLFSRLKQGEENVAEASGAAVRTRGIKEVQAEIEEVSGKAKRLQLHVDAALKNAKTFGAIGGAVGAVSGAWLSISSLVATGGSLAANVLYISGMVLTLAGSVGLAGAIIALAPDVGNAVKLRQCNVRLKELENEKAIILGKDWLSVPASRR